MSDLVHDFCNFLMAGIVDQVQKLPVEEVSFVPFSALRRRYIMLMKNDSLV